MKLLRALLLGLAVLAPAGITASILRSNDPSWDPSSLSVRYLAPIYGLFFLWVSLRLRTWARMPRAQWIPDLSAALLAASRTCVPVIPFSGHALFLAYTLATTPSRVYRVLALLFLVDTIYLKLVVWSAPWSLLAGLCIAVVLTIASIAQSSRAGGSPGDELLS